MESTRSSIPWMDGEFIQPQHLVQDEENVDHETIVAVLTTTSHVCAAAYDLETGLLYGIPDQVESDNGDVVQQMLTQLAPSRVIVTTTAPQQFLTRLKRLGIHSEKEKSQNKQT